jgi:hypothetical protein
MGLRLSTPADDPSEEYVWCVVYQSQTHDRAKEGWHLGEQTLLDKSGTFYFMYKKLKIHWVPEAKVIPSME